MQILVSIAFCALAGFAAAENKPADAKAEAAKADQGQLQGLWQAVSMEARGQAAREPAADEDVRKFQLLFKEGKIVFLPNADNREHAFEIDAKAKPKTLDITPGDGVKKGEKLPCAIYELDGDKLTLCINKEMTDGKRPTEFKSTATNGCVVIKFERVKSDK